MFPANGKTPPYLWLHTTSGHPVYAWMPDVAMEGENVEPANAEDDYMVCLPASRLRSIGMGANLGSAALIMCQADRHWNDAFSPFMVHQFVGWVLAHDCLPESGLFWPILASELELWPDDTRFLPYWKTGLGIESATKDVLVSAHARPGRAVLWIVNTSHQDRRATVRVDLAKLGFDSRKTVAFDAETGERYRLGRGVLAHSHTVTLDVPARMWRAVRLMHSLSPRERAGVRDAGATEELTFIAAFDGGEAVADEALGHRYARGRGPDAPKAEAEGKSGKGMSLDEPFAFDARHHAAPEQGTIAFQLKLTDPKANGTLVALGSPKLELRLDRGRLWVSDGKAKPPSEADAKAQGAGVSDGAWHQVKLLWRSQSSATAKETGFGISVDGGRVELGAPVPIRPMGRGLDIRDYRRRIEPGRITFGPIKGAAIDDLTMSR